MPSDPHTRLELELQYNYTHPACFYRHTIHENQQSIAKPAIIVASILHSHRELLLPPSVVHTRTWHRAPSQVACRSIAPQASQQPCSRHHCFSAVFWPPSFTHNPHRPHPTHPARRHPPRLRAVPHSPRKFSYLVAPAAWQQSAPVLSQTRPSWHPPPLL